MALDLSGLKDIHIPVEPLWWPPAIGWWILTGIFIISGFVSFGYWYTRPKQYAFRELKKLLSQSDCPIIFARQMSALFKRIALVQYPRKQVASLSEEAWMQFLIDKTKGTFSEKQAKMLAFSVYLPDNVISERDVKPLYEAGRQAIQELFNRKKHGDKSTKPGRGNSVTSKK